MELVRHQCSRMLYYIA